MSEVPFNQQFEVFSPLSYEYFKKKNLFDLLVGIRNYRRADFQRVPMMEKYYHCAKKCFVKRYCKCGGNSIDVFKFIKRVEDLPRGKLVKDLIFKEDLLKLEEILEYFN